MENLREFLHAVVAVRFPAKHSDRSLSRSRISALYISVCHKP